MTAKYDPEKMRERLKGVLKERGISWRTASTGAGHSVSYLSGVLEKKRDPQLSKIIAVCDYLDISPTWVLYGFDVPEGADEILQLLSEKPELTSSIVTLLRAEDA